MVDRPAGRSTIFAGRGDRRLARLVGKAQHRIGIGDIEIVADERHAEGRIQSVKRPVRVSATPSPSASRSSVMRLALGTAAPARSHDQAHHPALDALPSSGLGGALVSATRTSPLGST